MFVHYQLSGAMIEEGIWIYDFLRYDICTADKTQAGEQSVVQWFPLFS